MKKKAGTGKRLAAIAVMLLLCAVATVYILNLAHTRMEEARQAEIERQQAEAEQQAAEEAAAAEAETASETEETSDVASAPERVYSYKGSSDDEAYTMAAYDHAVEAGSGFISMPFVVSGDGTLFVADSDESQGLTGYSGYFSGMSDGQIAELKTRGGADIAKLSDIVEKHGKNINYIIELKYTSDRNIQALEDFIKKNELEGNVAIASTYFSGLRTLENDMPDIPKIFLCEDDVSFGEALGLAQVDTISVRKDLMIADYCKMAHDRGKKFGAWTLNTEDEIKSAIDMGVDSYFTDETNLAVGIEKN